MPRNRQRRGLRRVVVVVVTASSRAFNALRSAPRRAELRRHAAAVGKFGQHGAAVSGKVAFQGEHGAYSEEAVFQHFGESAKTLPCQSFEELFAAVESGDAAYGMLPMENSQAGSINKAYDLLMDFDLRVHGETILRVQHALMALPRDDGEAEPKKVRSHPQALAQCENYLKANGLAAQVGADTAGSAKEIADGKLRDVAAICSRLAAKMYGMKILQLGINDNKFNFTRFWVLAKGDAATPTTPKTSVVFAVSDKPGSLVTALEEFGRRDVNLVKLESRPRRRTAMPGFSYVFYLDFLGHHADEACRDALLGLLSNCAFVKLLGSYDAAPPLAEQLAGEDTGPVNDPTLMQI